jgi:hypothetical protein
MLASQLLLTNAVIKLNKVFLGIILLTQPKGSWEAMEPSLLQM